MNRATSLQNSIKADAVSLFEADDLLRRIINKARRFARRDVLKNISIIIASVFVFDSLLALLGGSYLSQNTGAFFGKTNAVILSDLLFIEGTFLLAFGIFIAVAKAWRETTPTSNPSGTSQPGIEGTGEIQVHFSVFMIIAGAILLGLSIVVGTLFP